MGSYPYASGKIRALEPRILDQTDIERMVDAPDFNTAFKVLNDTDYADNLLDLEPIDYRDALRADHSQLHQLLKAIIPDQKVFALLYINRDFLNIKLLIKAKFFHLEVKDELATDTVYPQKLLKDFILEDVDNGLDPAIKQIITEAIKKIESRTEPRYIDSLITQYYFSLLQKIAQQTHNQFIIGLTDLQANNANILVWLRAKRLKLEKTAVQDLLINQGSISSKDLLAIYEEPVSELRSIISKYYNQAVLNSFDHSIEKNSLFELEKELENFEINYCRQAKRIAYGPEVIVAYFVAKRVAVRNVRIIMTGKFNQVAAEEIKKTIRQTY